MFLWYTWAAVSNGEKHAGLTITTDGQIDLDLAAWRTESDGVTDDILDGASERMRICVFKDHRIRPFQTYEFAKRLCFEVSFSSYLFDQLREIHTLSSARGKTRLKTRKNEYLSHQSVDSGQVTLDLTKKILGSRGELLSQQGQRNR